MYGTLGIFAAVPSVHLLIVEYFNNNRDDGAMVEKYSSSTTVAYYGVMGAIYLTGLAILTFHIPERWVPKKFDIIGSSH